ncbi:MAG: acyltransferase [Pseudomonadota bacterium]
MSAARFKAWVKTSEHPAARAALRAARDARIASAPCLPGFHGALYRLHNSLHTLWSELWRGLYWTPLFRARLGGSGEGLHLAGKGMPLVTGPLDINVGKRCRFSTAITISGRAASRSTPQLVVGDNVGVGWQTTIAVGRRVVLGDNVRIAGRAFLAGYPGHPLDAADRAAGMPCTEDQIGDIILNNDVWLGTGCIISSGVEIGEGAVIAAGSIVTRDIPPFTLAAGAPARVVRSLRSDRDDRPNIVALRSSPS